MNALLLALFLVCGSTLAYEVVLTRLLSVISWYYLAFVSISMAMFGMTAGALSIQLRADLFRRGLILRRLAQGALGAAVLFPLALVAVLAVPIHILRSLGGVFQFVLVSAVMWVQC